MPKRTIKSKTEDVVMTLMLEFLRAEAEIIITEAPETRDLMSKACLAAYRDRIIKAVRKGDKKDAEANV